MKKINKLTCTANEYFWLKKELEKAQQNLQLSVFSRDGRSPSQRERTQAFCIIIEFYKKALDAFTPDSNTQVSNPVAISQKFLADLKTLDDQGLINIKMTRRGAVGAAG